MSAAAHSFSQGLNSGTNEEANNATWSVKTSQRKVSVNNMSANLYGIISKEPSKDVTAERVVVEASTGKAPICTRGGSSAFIPTSSAGVKAVKVDCQFQLSSSSLISVNNSWPNVAEGPNLCVFKDKNESFAQKVQKGSCWDSLHQSSVKINPFKKNIPNFQIISPAKCGSAALVNNEHCKYMRETLSKNGTDLQRNIEHCASSIAEQHETSRENISNNQSMLSIGEKVKEVGKKKKKRQIQSKKLPSQDSHVCIIDGSQKEKWLNPETSKLSVPKKCPPSLEKDFPDLSSALKLLSNSVTKHEFDESSADEADNRKSRGRKHKKYQPRWRDPISVNILDILKDSSDVPTKISSQSTGRIHARDLERRKLCGNILDSSNPIRKRGKHREIPRTKRLSKMKHAILRERSVKQAQRESKTLKGTIFCSKVPNDKPLISSICEGLTMLQIVPEFSDDNEDRTSILRFQKEQSEGFIEKIMEVTDGSQQTLKHLPQIKDILNTSVQANDNILMENLNHEILQIIPIVSENATQQNKKISSLHSRKFRDYCDNIRSQELDEAVTSLLKELYRFQDRHYQRDPIRAHAKRRFVLGIREVKKYLAMKKLKSIVIAPDLEPVKSPGGLDEAVVQIREEGRIQQVPVVFAVGRRQLGYALMKKVPISIIGIINPEGAEDQYRLVLELWQSAALKYQEKITDA